MTRIAIIQEYVPQYRVALFERLIEAGRASGLFIEVIAGLPEGSQASRSDYATPSFVKLVRQRHFNIVGRRLTVRSVKDAHRSADYVVLEQARRNVDAYRVFVQSESKRSRIAFWGHGFDHVTAPRVVERNVLAALTRRSGWFFGYTQGAVESVLAGGFPKERTTVLNNAMDTSALRSALQSLDQSARRGFAERYDLVGNTGLFVGALDESKRLDFLLAAADVIYGLMPGFRLLVVGDGPERGLVTAAAETRPWLHVLGHKREERLALPMSLSKLLLMPGRVGLVAVESFAAGLPIATTDWPWHAPEFAYLSGGENAAILPDSPTEYGRGVASLMGDQRALQRLRDGCKDAAANYSLDRMVDNFLSGLSRWVEVTS